ncbi:MAG: peptidase G2 autoproteolytic cleavage domain-containing protein [Saprospiraceae bacterium]
MKKIVSILLFQTLLLSSIYAQVIPKGMNYQAVARDQKGEVLSAESIDVRVYLFSAENNNRVNHYTEVHHTSTNEGGYFNLIIGEGLREHGEYGLIPWNKENIWMEVAIKDRSHSNFTSVSSSKLMAVPYAMHAFSAGEISSNQTANFAPPEPGVISTFWSVLGNAKTDASGNIYRINSLGTADFVDLIMITDNVERLRIFAGGDILVKQNFEVGQNLMVGKSLFVLKNATFCDSLLVKKNVVLNTIGGNTINYGQFTVANYSPTLFTGILTVDGDTYFNTTLNVDGTTNLNNRLNVNNMSPVKLTGTLTVDSTVTLHSSLNVLNQSPSVLTGTLSVDSMATFNDKVKILAEYQTDTSAGAPPSGALQVGGGAYIKENLYIGGVAKFGGPAVFGGAVTITDQTQSTDPFTGALKVTGGVGIGLNLNVGAATMIGGMLTIKDITQSTLPINGALKVLGGVGLRKNINVGGHVNIGGNFIINGASYLNNVMNVTNVNNYIASFENKTDRNGISIEVANSDPGTANNFITFRGSNSVVGRIEGQTAAELTMNPAYILELENLNSRILLAQLGVASSATLLASAIAGAIAAAASTTVCVGFGVCVTLPIISLIIQSAVIPLARAAGVVAAALGLNKANDNKTEFINLQNAQRGVTYESGAGDYAEWLPKLNKNETFLPGYIVALRNGKITKTIKATDKLMVISTNPAVLGNTPADGDKTAYEKVAFMGQVPVHVLGPVMSGDYIVPSGNHDGMGRSIAPDKMTVQDYSQIVGVAWSSSGKSLHNLINVAVGLYSNEISKIIADHEKIIADLESDFNQSNSALAQVVPGFTKKMVAEGVTTMEELNGAMNALNEKKNSEPNNVYPGNSMSNLISISSKEIDDMLSKTENIILEHGANLDESLLWKRLKSDPEYKAQFIEQVKTIFNVEVNKKLQSLKPN